MSTLQLLERGKKQAAEIIESRIRAKALDHQPLQIVEAGCGRYWPITLTGLNYQITGVDLDETALSLRQSEHNDLDKIVIGDLRYVTLPEAAYDVVYSSFVLEHIQGAELALNNCLSWLKPGGILILKIPDRSTVYGFVTRLTPYWFHVFFTKYIAKYKNVGEPGHGPYPTFYDKIVSREGINQFCKENNIRTLEEYGSPSYLNHNGIIYVFIGLFVKLVSILSLKSLPWRHNALLYVLEKT